MKKIIANTIDPEEVRVAILDERGKLCDIYTERMWERQRTGEIYKARVDSVLPGMNAAFLNLGDGRNGFLYLDDVRERNVKPGSDMTVQVVKSARKGKGARVTPRVSLAGRYMVLVPSGHETGVSKRIEDEEERARLRHIARSIKPGGYGFIVRTVAEGCSEANLRADMEELMQMWQEIDHKAKQNTAPCLIYRDTGLLERVLRDELDCQISEIVVDNEEEKAAVTDYLRRFGGDSPPEVNLYCGTTPLFELYNIESAIEEVLDRKVWLSSGAYLVIDQTEALTVVDVNTGKYTGTTNLASTVLKTNLEAASEIARQLRLRAIGGIVIIDFIDMENEPDKEKLISHMNGLLKTDRCRARVYGVTGLGLVEITRKRARPDLKSVMGRGCPMCAGNGWVEREDSVAARMKRFIRKICMSSRSPAMLIEAHPVVARYIAEVYLSSWCEEMERVILIVESPSMQWEKFRLDAQGTDAQIEHRIATTTRREERRFVHRPAST